MLTYLKVHNLALMDHLEMDFHEGFSALTGETGAGKSILIESIGFVLGDRSNKEIIRTGETKAFVEAGFTVSENSPAAVFLKENDLYDSEELVVYRDLSNTGKSTARINGVLVSISEIKTLGDLLIDLHGQHAHQSLLDETTHLKLLDLFSSDNSALFETRKNRALSLSIRKEISKIEKEQANKARRLEQIETEMNEIDNAGLKEGEEEELITARNRARYSSLIEEKLSDAYEMLHGENGALACLSAASSDLSALSDIDKEYTAFSGQIDSSYYILEDISGSIRDTLNTLSFSEDSLDDIESRLFLIENLKRKYGPSISAILRYRESLSEEKQILENTDEALEELREKEKNAFEDFCKTATLLSSIRHRNAETLERNVTSHLKEMGMPNAFFSIQFSPIDFGELNERGCEDAVFYFSANKGSPLKSLAKTASGGEISRVMLALKTCLAEADTIDTLIFDEIDTGISGMIAHSVAAEMLALSKMHQIICVTHLPQIAAAADRQYYIYKCDIGETTVSRAELLKEEDRPKELARIMGSDQSAAGLEHAKELLNNARKRIS